MSPAEHNPTNGGQPPVQGANAVGPDDPTLLRQYAQHGRSEAMGILFQRHAAMAYKTALWSLRNPSEAEDAVQLAFVKIMRTASAFRNDGCSVKSWIALIVRGVCRDMMKKASRQRKREMDAMPETETAPEHAEDEKGILDRIMRAVEELPEKFRLPFWLHHYEGMKFTEISRVMGVPQGTARTYAFRGMETIKKHMQGSGLAIPWTAALKLLRETPADPISQNLQEIIEDIVRTQGGSGVGHGKGNTLRAPFRLPVLTGLAALASAGAAFLLYRTHVSVPVVSPRVSNREIAPAVADGILAYWDFNTAQPPERLTMTQGDWRHVPDGGPDGSGCLEIVPDGDFAMMRIEWPVEQLPVRVSYRYAIVAPGPKDYPLSWSVTAFWEQQQPGARYVGLAGLTMTRLPKNVGPWFHDSHWISSEHTERWTEGSRTDFVVGERKENSRLMIGFRGRHRIDNLRIESVSDSDLPDSRDFIEAVRQIPESKRTSELIMPQFQSGRPDGTVKLVFFSGTE